MRVIFTPEAFEDLVAINLYLSQVTFLERADGLLMTSLRSAIPLGKFR